MNAGLHELPLVLFTVLAQSAVGAIMLMAVYLLLPTDNPPRQRKVILFLLLPLILLGLAFVASIMHLGSPLRAFNSLNRIGESALSNEIAGGMLFFAVAGLYWLLHFIKKMPSALDKLWLVLVIAYGCLFMFIMSSVYLISTVPTWDNPYTPSAFLLTAILSGFALGYALLRFADVTPVQLRFVPPILLLALVAAILLTVSQAFSLSDIQTSVQKASTLVADYGNMMMVRIALLFVGIGLLFYSRSIQSGARLSLCLCVLCILFAELIGRTLFYGLHMTAGTAIGS
ncbi:anaerobic dimethyl sulfoxide reductase subunit C (DMSO reductase anchor subunit) [Pasteurella testudinis DSM 23072]|uniref:Anaerobic dimethyl sulfoxide reductase subunit C (DMSO reductase anchor subunit) n=1 Tax=Pasteurella testudinis DSM 23072 TaxID=1122938 RepID=A0A1W1UGI0_9PAST|nr:DmsC/YnfH family molybdoenzyme membrane anchor subunit [Pasteurella testudinis]SMB80196.1 anaerobic dimethyl sulfoxide reductase subunit C (DMSO reductase anchor subunit) [Pasteurella testudinis DSM 23072]SUB50573.1 anaerobic dimethyl sulfoxide reductase chain C [Pasteurella testudinis]